MGQEVLYLLLVTSLICNVLLVAIAIHSSTRLTDSSKDRPSGANLAATIKRLEIEKSQWLTQAKEWEASVRRLEAERSQLVARVKVLEQQSRLKEQPPIITLRDTEFHFDPGSSDITPEFLERLAKEVVPRLSALGEEYGAQIVEIIGHTDGTSINDRLRIKANLDDFLGQDLDPSATVAVFPYDNVGLGIARAVSVARALRQSGLPAKFDIQPLSAAYLIAPNDRTLAAPRKVDDPSRRRIEIRIRRVNAN
jgi:outer membrane protein OmpA-like peptidoglycan-associated protein